MDLGLTEVQQMLKNSAREFLSQECPLDLVREMEDDPQGYTDQLWRQVVDLGWLGIPFPEQYGGTGGTFLDLAVFLEEAGRALMPGPFFPTVVLGGLTVLDAGSEAQKDEVIPGICSGRLKLTLAVTEASATWEPWGVEATATRQGDGYVLNGVKLFVPYAHVADTIIVAARTSSGGDSASGITLFLVPAQSSGVTITPLQTISSDRQYEVALNDVAVPASAVLGEEGAGWPVVERALQRAVAGRVLEMAGGAESVLDMTVEYTKQRAQFGRPVGTFQAVQHHCANMSTDVEGTRQVAYQAAWKVSEGLPAQREVSMAKAWASGAYHRVCTSAHQCHGAIGFTREHDLQLYTRRAKVQELHYGDLYYHRELALQHIDQ